MINRNPSSPPERLGDLVSGEAGTGAIFSRDKRYRYALWRRWAPQGSIALFVGLNPSTANGSVDDPTIRRCQAFARRWGMAGTVVVNLYAFRAARPIDLFRQREPMGIENDRWIQSALTLSSRVIACWGNHGERFERGARVLPLLGTVECLGVTKRGHPIHPLYLPGDTEARPFQRTSAPA